MALNLVSEIMRWIAPAAMERIAAALGINGDLAQKGIAAAVPALLAALGNKASTAGGARDLFNAVSNADPDIFSKLGTSLTGAKADKYMESGTSALTSLLGDSALSSLTGAVAKYAGLGGTAGSSLMSIAAPLVLGALAKNSSGMDASGLANLLGSQQDNIKAALPAGLGSLLSSAGVLGSNFASQAGRTAADVGRTASTAASRVTPPAKSGTNWLMWLIPIALIAAGLWYFLGNRAPTTTTTTDTTTTAPAVTDMMLDGVDIGKQVTTVIDGLKTSLSGITDVATAQAALPKLQEAVTAIDGVSGMLGKLSVAQKSALAALVTAALPTIKDAATKVLAIQGVGDVAKPVVDSLISKLEALAKAA